jgi:hypothetical protein
MGFVDSPKNGRGGGLISQKIVVGGGLIPSKSSLFVCPTPVIFFCLFWPEFDPTHNEKAVAKSNQNRRRLGAQPQRF